MAAPVIAESAWLIERRLGAAAEAALPPPRHDRRRPRRSISRWTTTNAAIDLVEQYADLGLGFVDASIVAVAERMGVVALATLNHRDFHAVRPNHVEAFDLVP